MDALIDEVGVPRITPKGLRHTAQSVGRVVVGDDKGMSSRNMKVMRVDFDPEVQAWYITLSDAPVSTTVHISDEVAVDVDESGAAVGVEFLIAPSAVDQPVRERLFERFPVVRKALAKLQAAVA